MTTTLTRPASAEAARWRSVFADLTFWTVTGAIVAVLSGPLADLFGADQTWLLIGGVTFVVGGLGLLYELNRARPTPRALVETFAAFNLVLAPMAYATAAFGWLPLSTAGNWALATAGDAMLVLGIMQVLAVRRRV